MLTMGSPRSKSGAAAMARVLDELEMDRLIGELQAWMKQQERATEAIFAGRDL